VQKSFSQQRRNKYRSLQIVNWIIIRYNLFNGVKLANMAWPGGAWQIKHGIATWHLFIYFRCIWTDKTKWSLDHQDKSKAGGCGIYFGKPSERVNLAYRYWAWLNLNYLETKMAALQSKEDYMEGADPSMCIRFEKWYKNLLWRSP
jgi:hypothetical protein